MIQKHKTLVDNPNGVSSHGKVESTCKVQFPLSVFFELTIIVAVVFVASDLIGWLSAMGLSLMAISILLRQGVAAIASFVIALHGCPLDQVWGATGVCIFFGVLIASWPLTRGGFLCGLTVKTSCNPRQ